MDGNYRDYGPPFVLSFVKGLPNTLSAIPYGLGCQPPAFKSA